MEKVPKGGIPEAKLHLLHNRREKRAAGVCTCGRVWRYDSGQREVADP